ncbi:hypothetical protein [Agromyces laixinhei]|uniref:hypothetical protein n=1 Tax=Agromyces laixinhei TaxID=2585717 RepID=UPI0012ECC5E1|nr:hypothetical protein [Agromyces laixinhei]
MTGTPKDDYGKGPPTDQRPWPWARYLAFGVFIVGILVPTLLAFVSVWNIAMHNAPFFGQIVQDPIDPSTDPTLRITGVIMAVSSAILLALVIIRRLQHRWLVSGIILTAVSMVPLALIWYILLN